MSGSMSHNVAPRANVLHPARKLCALLQVFLTKQYLAIAMEYAAGGDMFQYVKHRGGLEEVEARWFFQQLIIGMDYCHKMVRPLLRAIESESLASSHAGKADDYWQEGKRYSRLLCLAGLSMPIMKTALVTVDGGLQGVVNRDIKLENTLLDGSKRPLLKICDFGYSKNDKDSVPKSKVGTPGYTGEHNSPGTPPACLLSGTHAYTPRLCTSHSMR